MDERNREFDKLLVLNLFTGLRKQDDHLMDRWVSVASTRDIKAGDWLFREGAVNENVYLTQDGEVDLIWKGQTYQTLTGAVGVGMISGAANRSDLNALAKTDFSAVSIPLTDFLRIIADNFETLRIFLTNIASLILSQRALLGPTAGFSSEIKPSEPIENPLGVFERLERLVDSLYYQDRIDIATEILNDVTEVRRAAGTQLWAAGDLGDKSILILSGEVRCTAHSTEQRFSFGPGDIVGWLGAFSGSHRWYDADVVVPLVGLVIPTQSLMDTMEDHTDYGMYVLGRLCDAIINLRLRTSGLLPDDGDVADVDVNASVDS